MSHSSALFTLLPLNDAATAVVESEPNKHLVSESNDGSQVLEIGNFASASKDSAVLATLGRDGDIVIPGKSISKIQCSFEINVETNIVMFYDKSHSQTTQVMGKKVFPFEYGRPRRVAVLRGVNTAIGMGGIKKDMIQFAIVWPEITPDLSDTAIQTRAAAVLKQNPRFARTLDPAPETALPTGMATRIHTPGVPRPAVIRFHKIGKKLGSGSFGDVYKAVDVDDGRIMAVKIVKQAAGFRNSQQWLYLKREIQAHTMIDHENMIEFLGSQDWDKEEASIFMALKEGTLHSLVGQQPGASLQQIAKTTLHHMLKALDYLAVSGLVHRDLKPENILYERTTHDGSGYHFRLGDLGFCNAVGAAATYVGTPNYTAPEIVAEERQTPKVDIWSLFVVILWTLDVEGFRAIADGPLPRREGIRQTILRIAATSTTVSQISDMGRRDPEKRASAAQMLIKCFNGDGLSSARHLVPHISPLHDTRAATIPIATTMTNATAAAAAIPTTTARPPRRAGLVLPRQPRQRDNAHHLFTLPITKQSKHPATPRAYGTRERQRAVQLEYALQRRDQHDDPPPRIPGMFVEEEETFPGFH